MDTNNMENNETNSSVLVHSANESEPLLSEDHNVTRIFSKVCYPSCRFVLIFMGFLGFVNIYCLRVSLSVALVAMVNHTEQPNGNMSHNYSSNNTGDICKCKPSESIGETVFGKEDGKSGEFNWDSNTQGTVLAAFFYGYIITQV